MAFSDASAPYTCLQRFPFSLSEHGQSSGSRTTRYSPPSEPSTRKPAPRTAPPSYRIEEGYAMIDQGGEQAHQSTFAESPGQASDLLRQAVRFERYDTEIEVRSPGPAVRAVDTNVDYRTVLAREGHAAGDVGAPRDALRPLRFRHCATLFIPCRSGALLVVVRANPSRSSQRSRPRARAT